MTGEYPPAEHEHVPDCDDYAFSGAGFHPTCERSCICRQVARVEHRVIGEAVQRVEVLLKEWWEKFEGTPSDLKEMKSMVALNRAIVAIDARQKNN